MRMERTQITTLCYFPCVHLLVSATMGVRLPCLSRELGIVVDCDQNVKVIGHKYNQSNSVYICTTTLVPCDYTH